MAAQENAIHAVENFDKSKLKRRNTLEKQVLPDVEGNDVIFKIRYYMYMYMCSCNAKPFVVHLVVIDTNFKRSLLK